MGEMTLFKGSLCKFQAGFKNSFTMKWIVVTKNALRCYKSREASIINPTKPLFAVPIQAVEAYQKVDYELGIDTNQLKHNGKVLKIVEI